MKISLDAVGVAEVQAMLRNAGTEAPKAVKLWANWIGLEAQGAMQNRLPGEFHFRGTAELFKKAIVFKQAHVVRGQPIEAVLRVGSDGVGGTKASATKNLGSLLARHENAESRTARNQIYRKGDGSYVSAGFFLPAKGLRTDTTNPPRSMYPTSVGAQVRFDPSGNAYFAKGTKKGTKRARGVSYFVTDKGIFRRVHTAFSGRVQVEAVWWFVDRVRTPARLHLWDTALRVFQERGVALGMQAVEEALYRATL